MTAGVGRAAHAAVIEVDFDRFYSDDYRAVVRLVAAITGRHDLAEEVAQEAFLRALNRWAQIGHYDEPGAWVRRVAVNLAVSGFRRRRREIAALARLAGRRRDRNDDVGAGDLAFWRAVRNLPPRQAQCIVLRYVEDRPATEIGRVLGIEASSVRAHLHQARQKLAMVFGEQEFE